MDARLDIACERWGLSDPRLIAETPRAQVYRVTQESQPAALKLLTRVGVDSEAMAPAWLRHWRDHGAVRVRATAPDALLLEWLPGPSLGDRARAGDDSGAAKRLGRCAMHLHACRAVADTIRATPLASHLSALLDHPAPTAEMDQARALARQLLKTAPTPRPLHGDLHHDNVICDTEGTWRVIDPKGLLGDPAFDLANAFRNPVGLERQAADPRRMQRRAEIFAAETGYPTHRLLAWAAVQAAVSIAWDGAEARDVADHAILATALTLAGPRS